MTVKQTQEKVESCPLLPAHSLLATLDFDLILRLNLTNPEFCISQDSVTDAGVVGKLFH